MQLDARRKTSNSHGLKRILQLELGDQRTNRRVSNPQRRKRRISRWIQRGAQGRCPLFLCVFAALREPLLLPGYDCRHMPLRWRWYSGSPQAGYFDPSWRGFIADDFITRHFREHMLTSPHWAAAALFTLLPGLWLWQFCAQRRRKRKYSTAHCGRCGYDLRASKDRCPECGTPTPSLISTAAHMRIPC